jgi:hypothetical protein
MRHVWQKRWPDCHQQASNQAQGNIPHAVAVRSVGVSIQMTQVKVLNVVAVSSGFCCALTASSRGFCSMFCTVCLSVERSISSTATSGVLLVRPPEVPSFGLRLFAEGPGVGLGGLECRGASGDADVPVKST